MTWHSMHADDVLATLGTSPRGLSAEEARRRLERYGPNELVKEKKKPLYVLFLEQFKSFLIIILLIATAISIAIGELLDALVVIAIVVACAVLGFVEEYRSERALEMLKKLAAPTALVLRDGEERVIPSREVVPGDIVILHMGDKVPADGRLIEAVNLKVDEAPLTGESIPVEKCVEPLPEDTPVPDRVNMVFSGTTVVYGRGRAVVTATGMNTEFGRIAAMVQVTKEEETPLERRMAHVGRWLGIMCLAVCGVVALLGLIRGHKPLEMLIWGISLAVAAVPEALPAVVTGALAIGMHEMAKRNAIVRRLPAVETLGCTSIICADKTGTMTKGEMTVRKIYVDGELIDVTGVGYTPEGEFLLDGEPLNVDGNRELELLLKAGALCSDARLHEEEGRWVIRGDTTEGALVVVAAKAGLWKEKLDNEYPRVGEIPFTSERKRMTTFHECPDAGITAYMKGAPEIVLERCKYILENGEVRELTDDDRRRILEVNEELASSALRNLAVAFKPMESLPEELDEDVERDFTFVGIVGMIDPPREETIEAIRLCRNAGIRVVMITGDHKLTAVAVAKEVGLLEGDDDDRVLTGAELDRMSDEEFEKIVEDVIVYARVSPEHKVKIVKALKSKGYIVAMTGDGINDAPALKIADIGVAMGITGTEVTKEASDMVLADDNFATIVSAVKEGRRIFDNIKKYLTYLLRCNIMEILIMFVASLLGWDLPLTAIQILWVNLTTDGLPALALGVDPAEPDVMERPPRDPKESVFSTDVKLYLALVPPFMTAILLSIFMGFGGVATPEARAQIFTSMVFMELASAASCRSLKRPIFRVGAFANKFLWISIAVSALMQVAALTPPLCPIFDVAPPTVVDWAVAAASAVIVFVSTELAKYIVEVLR